MQEKLNDKLFKDIPQDNFDQRFKSKQYINRGSGCKVSSAYDCKEQRAVAIKQYNNYQLIQAPKDIEREITILQFSINMSIDVVMGYYGAYHVIDHIKKSSIYCLILQLCSQSLAQFIHSEQYKKLTIVQKLKLFLKITKQVKILHDYNIIHRDLKPGNILFVKRGQQEIPVIADFGHSKQILDNVNTNMKGTIIYANPNQIEDTNYGLEWDIYSLGVILAEMFKGDLLFKLPPEYNTETKRIQKLREVLKDIDKILNDIPSLTIQMKELIKQCLNNGVNLTADKVILKIDKIIKIEEDKQTSTTQIKQAYNAQMINKISERSQDKNKQFPQSISKNSTTASTDALETPKQPTSKTQINSEEDDLKLKNLKNERSESLQSKGKSQLKQSKVDKVSSDISEFNKTEISDAPHFVRKSMTYNNLSELNQKQESLLVQTEKSIKLKKQDSVSLRGSKNERQFICQTQNVARAIACQAYLQKKSAECASAQKELIKFKKYQIMFKNLRKIEDSTINEKTKKKLLILGLKNIISQLMVFQKQNSVNNFTVKFASELLDKLKNIQVPITKSFLQKHQNELNPSSEKVFINHNSVVADLKQQFKNTLHNLSNPLVFTQLQHILD